MFDQSLTETSTASAQALKEIKDKVDNLWHLKNEADIAEKSYNKAKSELTAILEESGVDKVQGDDCTVSLALKNSCSVPKDLEGKAEVFSYIAQKQFEHDQTKKDIAKQVVELMFKAPVLGNMLTINPRTFSSFSTAECEAKAMEGVEDFKIPATKPFEYYSLNIRKRSVRKK